MDVAKRAVHAFNRRDVELLLEQTATDFEWFPGMPQFVAGDSFRGGEGVEQYFEAIAETWLEYRAVIVEFRDLGDRVLALGRLEGRGRGSGAPGVIPCGVVSEFRGAKIASIRTYLDHAEALKAVGLEE